MSSDHQGAFAICVTLIMMTFVNFLLALVVAVFHAWALLNL